MKFLFIIPTNPKMWVFKSGKTVAVIDVLECKIKYMWDAWKNSTAGQSIEELIISGNLAYFINDPKWTKEENKHEN